MSGSESEEDFMSDKFLASVSEPAVPQTYSARRNQQTLKSLRAGQANAKPTQKLAVREEIARREGLERNLFEEPERNAGGNKAMAMMMKMGWTPGESMGKKKEEATGSKRTRDEEGDDEDAPRGGIGSSSRLKVQRSPSPPAQRTEPIRISMWQRRKGLTARSPTPPPPPMQGVKDPDALDAEKLARLGRATDSFRDRQRREFEVKEIERRSWKARERLVEFDHAKGIMFHPLHVSPSAPNETIPKPLKALLFPEYSPSPSPPPGAGERIKAHRSSANMSEAERIRAQMRRDMLQPEDGSSDDEHDLPMDTRRQGSAGIEEAKIEDGIDWESHLSGVKRVLNEDPATYLELVISQLRFEHLFCFWCAAQYASFAEMEGPGGCPGEDEDSH